MADLIGQRLGNYRLLRLIGHGGFADVYLGEHIHLGTQAAIKVLQVRLVESNKENFLNEARTIAHLIHPYIIRVLDFGVENEIPFLVMDYAPGGTFRQRYLQGKPLPAAPLASFMKQMAAALQYGHDKKLIHRDVKPENMLLGTNDEILLSDFGFALIVHNSASITPTETAGTAAYMAPEQLQGKPGPASDQYALGIIAYEWLSGRCPFQGSFFEIASQQVFTPPPSLREKIPAMAPEIVKVVMTALEKDPRLRFPTVRDFALALEDACLVSKQYAFDLSMAPVNNDPALQPETSRNMPGSGTQYTSMGRIRPLTNITMETEQERLIAALTQRSASRVQLLPSDDAVHSRAAFTGPSTPHAGPDHLSGPASYGFSMDMQPVQYRPPLQDIHPLPPLPSSPFMQQILQPIDQHESLSRETFSSSTTLQQGYQQSEIVAPDLSSIQASAPASPFSRTEEAASQDSQPAFSQRNAAPLHSRPPGDKIGGPDKILLISLIILLIIAVGAGFYSYNMHNTKPSTTQTTSPAKRKSAVQPTPPVSIRPTATPSTIANTANPYPPYSGTFVLNEPLTSNNYGWQESAATTTGGSCKFVEGGYQNYNPIIDPNPCFATSTNFTNFTYQVDMKFTAIGQLHSGGGIVFRGNSTTNTYYYFEVYNSGKYSLEICNAGNCALQLAGYKFSNQALEAFHPGLNVTNTLAVVANGPKFDLYVNNQFIKEVVDANNTYPAGMIGVLATGGNNNNLRTVATSTPAQVLFSNAKVWKM